MIAYLKLFYYYGTAVLKDLFAIRSCDTVLHDALRANFGYKTYRFPMHAPDDKLISLRILKMILKSAFVRGKIRQNNTKSGIGIFDLDLGDAETRCNYVQRLSNESSDIVVPRNELKYNFNPLLSLLVLPFVLTHYPIIILISLFSKNKLKYPFHVLNAIEAVNLLYLLRKNEISKLHYFCIYESDSNLLAYVLMKCGININKIPSEVPLQFWNKIIVADSLSFCFRYQEEEYGHYKKTMHVKKIQHWIPESSLALEEDYAFSNRKTELNVVGFYSSGMWYRKSADILDLEDADLYEKQLLKYLQNFVNKHPKYVLKVFLHPIEKQHMEKTIDYYNGFPYKVEFSDIKLGNPKQFFNSDVVVTLYSTLAFERVFWGFKTIIFPLGQKDFPIKNSVLNGICAKSQEELDLRLLEALETPVKDYFAKKGMSNYCYEHYSIFEKKMHSN